jgi:hypothetical protein
MNPESAIWIGIEGSSEKKKKIDRKSLTFSLDMKTAKTMLNAAPVILNI